MTPDDFGLFCAMVIGALTGGFIWQSVGCVYWKSRALKAESVLSAAEADKR